MNYIYIFTLITLISFDSCAMLKVKELQKKIQDAQIPTPQVETKNNTTALARCIVQKQIAVTKSPDELAEESFSYADDEIIFRQKLFILHQIYRGDCCREIRKKLSKKLQESNKKIELYPCSCLTIKSQ